MRKLKYLLFLMIIFVSPVVFALDYDVTSQITSPVSPSGVGTYTGEENNGATYSYNIRTTYDGTLQAIRFNLPVPINFVDGTCFSNNIEYKVTMFMADNDWRNRFGSVFVGYSSSSNENFSNGNVTFVSMRQIYFTFKIPSGNTYCYNSVYVNLRSSDLFIPFTGDTNWNLSSVILTDPTSSSGGSSGSGSSNQDIIDNQTNNTNNIITNNNSNTTNIIDNNNQNTQDIINNQNNNSLTCSNDRVVSFTPLMEGYYIDNGYNSANSNFNISNFIGVKENSNYTINFNDITGMEWGYMCWYHDQQKLSCSQYRNMTGYSQTNFIVTSPSGANYLQVTYRNNSNANIKGYICTNKVDDSTNNIINNQNSNTQQQIESQKVCKNYDKSSNVINGKYLDINGNYGEFASFGITDYIPIRSSSTLTVIDTLPNSTAAYCFYNSDREKIYCRQLTLFVSSVSIPVNASYLRVSINNNSNKPIFSICNNGNQALTDSITDDNIDNGVGSDFFDDFNDQDFGLSQIITIPLTTIQSLTSKTCVSLQVPIPFTNSNVSLPCMTEIYQTKFPSIYNIWKIVSFGIISYLIAIDIFHIVKGFKDPESDKVEVLDL